MQQIKKEKTDFWTHWSVFSRWVTNTNYNNVLLVDGTLANNHTISINLTEIIWGIPQYTFSLSYTKAKINNEIAASTEYEMYYRHWMYAISDLPPCTVY